MNPVATRMVGEVARRCAGLLVVVLLVGAWVDQVDGRTFLLGEWPARAVTALPFVSVVGAGSVAVGWKRRRLWEGAEACGVSPNVLALAASGGVGIVVLGASLVLEAAPFEVDIARRWLCFDHHAEQTCVWVDRRTDSTLHGVRWMVRRDGRILDAGHSEAWRWTGKVWAAASTGDPVREAMPSLDGLQRLAPVPLEAPLKTHFRTLTGGGALWSTVLARGIALLGGASVVAAAYRRGAVGALGAVAATLACTAVLPMLAQGVRLHGWPSALTWGGWITASLLLHRVAAGGLPWPKARRG